jgi:DNA processing protein
VRDASPDSLSGTVSTQAYSNFRDFAVWAAALERANRTIQEARRYEVTILTVADEQYPDWLRTITDHPPLLFLKGKLQGGLRHVATIGTREPSLFGEEVTRRIVSVLAEKGWSIVSGLALGIDALSHQAALDSGGHTVAILGNGLDTVYPKKNARLAEEILTNGGALLSEQMFGTPAIPRNLVQRDRLQCGMSAGTVVMQTDVIGGSMHTVRFTLMQKRLLFAPVPSGSHANERPSRGTMALTHLHGPELARLLNANGEYASLLENDFRDRLVATPLTNRDDYMKLLSMLDTAISSRVSKIPLEVESQLKLF